MSEQGVKRSPTVAAALDHIESEREQVNRGHNGRSALTQKEAVALADYALELARALSRPAEEGTP